MTTGAPPTSVEEIAASWPEEAFTAALVCDPGMELPFEALDLVVALSARRRPAILVSLVPGAALPDEGSEAGQAPGLAAVARGEATLKEAARARTDRPFAFIAAGAGAEPRELLESPALGRLARGIRSAGGILVVHVPEGLEAPPPVWMDGRVVAGDISGDARFGSELPLLGRLETSPPAAAAKRTGRWRRHRKGRSTPWARIAAAVTGIAVILAGWWFLARETVETDAGAAGVGPETPGAVVDTEGGAGPTIADTGTAAGDTAGTGAAAEAEAAAGEEATGESTAGALPYSVLVASYGRAADAAARVERMRESVAIPVFAAPTTVGDRLYHRVLAGARTDSASAAALMRGLADRGLKRSTSGWDLRPVRWSLLLGRYPTDSAARRARRGLGSAAVYAYLLREPGARDTAHLLFAGSYESSTAARQLQQILEADGHESEVLIRRGEPR